MTIEGISPHPVLLPTGEGRLNKAQRMPHRPLSHPHPQADADILKWPARLGELARERDRMRGDPFDCYARRRLGRKCVSQAGGVCLGVSGRGEFDGVA